MRVFGIIGIPWAVLAVLIDPKLWWGAVAQLLICVALVLGTTHFIRRAKRPTNSH